jgi:hypothetical protein
VVVAFRLARAEGGGGMSELKALLFNVDGTLTKELHRQAFNLGWN